MKPTRINFHNFSNAFWAQVEDYTQDSIERQRKALQRYSDWCDALRSKASYDTGSITFNAMLRIARICMYYQPEAVVEVGTFIGRSTFALDMNASKVFTCDKDNDCLSDEGDRFRHVVFYPKQTSQEMLDSIMEPVDLFFFDGRISDGELPTIAKLINPESVFVFDDFVGTEKGVKNVIKLQSVFKNYVLIEPRDGIALMVPQNIHLTHQ